MSEPRETPRPSMFGAVHHEERLGDVELALLRSLPIFETLDEG